MHMDAGLYTKIKDPLTSIGQFFRGPISDIPRDATEEEVVMDVGCGPGKFSTRLIVPLFPNLKRIFAVDLQPNMIECAIANHHHPKVEYSVANIEEWSSVSRWEGQISCLFAIHVFHWIKDQRQSFYNVWRLLKPGGHAVFFFVLHSTFFETCLELQKDVRWNDYLKDVDIFVPHSHIDKYGTTHYTDMLVRIGFSIEYCNSEVKEDIFPSDERLKDFFSSICVFLPHIPEERREEFKDHILSILLRKNGRNNGLPVHRGRMLELIVRKS